MSGNLVGVAQQHFNVGAAKAMQIPLPPLPTQRRIASALSTYDNLIENNTRRIAILEEMARRLYEEWFVQFRFPGHEKGNDDGMLPTGWQSVPFSSLADFVNGHAFKPTDWGNEGLPIVKIKELKAGITSETPRFSDRIADKYIIRNGDILFSWSADLDAYIWHEGEAWLNQHLFNVFPRRGISKLFIFFSLRQQMQGFRSRSAGTTMKHIKRSALDEVHCLLPLQGLRDDFDAMVAPMVGNILNLKRKNANLRAQRDLLLPKLISGEIDVSNLPLPGADEQAA